MSTNKSHAMDGNEAVASVAFRLNEVCCIYPITPSSPMGEYADQWSCSEKKNIWGNIPTVYEMQSEGGAAGALHGALQTGSLTTTFTASQGLLLMIPNMYKIAGELTSAVMHVAARSLAAQGLSIFGDHSDVMAVRSTGFAMLCSNTPQQAHDMAAIAQAASLESRLPILHFFDGFRTSHEINTVEVLEDDDLRFLIDDDKLIAHRERALSPDRPCMRGTAQNPDIYFQGRESVNPFYSEMPAIVQKTMDKFAARTGRAYKLFQYFGHEEAENVLVLMGSACETVCETVNELLAEGRKCGVLQVHLFRPFSIQHFIEALPAKVKNIAVLDRTKEPGSSGEPLYLDVVNAFFESQERKNESLPKVIGGRYGLSSKEFTPAMVKAVFDELEKSKPKNHFTVGINDDLSGSSLEYDIHFNIEDPETFNALFYGLGSDGTVGANKNSIKILGEESGLFTQAYFVYDSKKSGSQTISHLRFGKRPIRSTYLIQRAQFVACHHFEFIKKQDVLKHAAEGAVFLLNAPYSEDAVWQQLPSSMQKAIASKKIQFYVIDATRVAKEVGLGSRTNTIMQTCFFVISGILEKDKAIAKIRKSIEETYSKKGEKIVDMNFKAVDAALKNLRCVDYLKQAESAPISLVELIDPVPESAPEFVRKVTGRMMAGEGDLIPVSEVPADGTYPTATSKWEKRNIASQVPEWDPLTCVQCGNCSFVCPHSVIRTRFYNEAYLEQAPAGFKSAAIDARGYPEVKYSLQVYTEDCTGCGLCVEVCPVSHPDKPEQKAINLVDNLASETNKSCITFFESLPLPARKDINYSTVKGVQFLDPLFEFPGACAGCGETPYLKLASQLFGDRMLVANATGCSSIYGGNLPTTPWTKNADGRGPAWSNSLFEDNAEFGLGFRLSVDAQTRMATQHLSSMKAELCQVEPRINEDFLYRLISAEQVTESQIQAQRERVALLKSVLANIQSDIARQLLSLADCFVRKSVWIVGGDGWAYDIGSSGLDHVLASGRDVNILVMDTEVYSNTGGQMSKATPLGAVAKFASMGKQVSKKDLALQAIAYGNVYVARVAIGANPQQTLLAMREAEAYSGTSIILAYSHCIAHGIDMRKGLEQQRLAVESGYWPLLRFNPAVRTHDGFNNTNPFILDSRRPSIPFRDYAYNELRYSMLQHSHPEKAKELLQLAERNVLSHWAVYEEMATRNPHDFIQAASICSIGEHERESYLENMHEN